MAYHRAAQIISGSAAEESAPGVGLRAALDVEILGVNVLCVFCDSAHRLVGGVVGAGKVAYVNEQTEIGICDSRDELFNAVAVLRKKAVVLNHSRDALLCGIFCHSAAALNEGGQSLLKPAVSAKGRIIAACCIVAHSGSAEYLRYVHLLEQALALLVERAVEKFRADGVVDYRQPRFFALVAQALGVVLDGHSVFGQEVDKFDSVKAHFLDLAYELKLGYFPARKHRLKAVAADAGFHIFSPQSMYPLRKLTAFPISFSGSSPTSRSIVRKPL